MVGNWIKKLSVLCIISALVGCGIMKKEMNVACIGDSITYGYLLPEEESYPYKLDDLLPDNYTVYNSSEVGMSAYDYMMSNLYREMIYLNPDIVVIMFGSNDSNLMYFESIDYFRQYYTKLIDSFEESTVYLCTPCAPYSENYGVNEHNLLMIVDEIKKIGKEKEMQVIDIYSLTVKHPEWFEMDGIHPNSDGTSAIAMAIYEAIDEILF